MRRALVLIAIAVAAGCGEPDPPAPEPSYAPDLIDLRVASPVLPGSPIGAVLSPTVPRGTVTQLVLRADHAEAVLPYVETHTGAWVFAFDAPAASAIGTGTFAVEAVVQDTRFATAPTPWTFYFADHVEPVLTSVSQGSVYYNDQLVLTGGGMLDAAEGEMVAHWQGTFVPDDGDATAVDLTTPVTGAEPYERSRGVTYVPIALGGLRTGDFNGTLTLETQTNAGIASSSTAVPVSLAIAPPTVFGVASDAVYLGEYVVVSGGGFLYEPGTSTVLSLDGTFTPLEGEPVAVSGFEMVPSVEAGGEARWYAAAVAQGKALVAEVVGYGEGVFEGTLGVSTSDGSVELVGDPAPLRLELLGAHQVVYVTFLPGFEMSLERFGLAAAVTEIQDAVLERMRGIYADYGVEVRGEEPVDYDPNHYSRLEIGGTDPNGLGLFGYDNTPGKDVYNLRLFDAIGGANAETQEDSAAGYGGVFIESLLWWSATPPLPGERPVTAPQPDPNFDWLFSEFFDDPATLAEIAGLGDAGRVERVARAIRALGNIIGETAAHELGHSLGLAEPEGEDTVYHNPFDEPGCLMDSGSDRPLGERAALDGYEQTHFCYDAPEYLHRILR